MWPLLLLGLAFLLWLLAGRARRATGLPTGEVVYTDTRAWTPVAKPFYSAHLGLTGKPDYVVRVGDEVIPVEIKSGRTPPGGPHEAHIYQLAAYCVLVAEAYGRRPRYGLLQYADQTHTVLFTAQLEQRLLHLLTDLRADREADDVARSHRSPARCRGCGLRAVCDDRLM